MEYRVTWDTDVDADTPEQAAQAAWDREFRNRECVFFQVQPTANVGITTAPAPVSVSVNVKTGAKE